MRDSLPLLLTALYLFATEPAGAGSLIEKQLSTVKEIAISVVAPRYEPIPGVLPDKLESMILSRVTAIARRHKLEISDSSSQNLTIRIKAEQGAGNGMLAILVLCELREPAVLTREWEPSGKEKLTVTSWRESRVILASSEDVLEKLSEAAELEARDFAQDVMSAKAAVRRNKNARAENELAPAKK